MARHPSELSVIDRAEQIVKHAGINMFNNAKVAERESAARKYRERWRIIGLGLGTLVLIMGLATTNETTFLNVGWIVGALLAIVIGAMIGRYVYRKQTPW
jgi:hypothetical protein